MQNSIYKIKYLLFLSWDWEAWCLTVWGVIHPPERNTAWNKGRKCFHCLVAPNNLIRPWNWPTSNFYLRPAHTSSLNYPLPIGALLGNPTLLCLSLKVPGKRDPPPGLVYRGLWGTDEEGFWKRSVSLCGAQREKPGGKAPLLGTL